MKRLVIVGCIVINSICAFSQSNGVERLTQNDRRYAAMERMGGRLAKPDTQKGCIRIINAQTEISTLDIRPVGQIINTFDKFKVEFNDEKLNGNPIDLATANKDAGVVIIVVANEKSSPLLVSPDEHWAIVNVSKLRDGLKTKEAISKFLPSRCRKQIIRAYVLACTGNGSQYVKNFFYNTKVSDFDLYHEFLPMDAATRCKEFLGRNGVLPTQFVSYRKACREGWAPAPTNDVQKAVWNQVHEIPTNPIKITFDPKTDTK